MEIGMVLRSSVTLLVGSMACLLIGCAEERGAPPQEIMNQQMDGMKLPTGVAPAGQQPFKASDHFAEYDQNADGKLTEKEIEAWMDGADADKNGEITQQELADWKPPAGQSGPGAAGATGAAAKKKGGFGTGAAGTGTGEGTSP
tara:strand:+ start:403 stop:834 length:432 start_codon:yes stop_codon:yes gene_type:complete